MTCWHALIESPQSYLQAASNKLSAKLVNACIWLQSGVFLFHFGSGY